jgi:L-fuconolactonase
MIPIVDTHQHLWDRSLLHLPWIQPDTVLDRNYTIADYQTETAGQNIAMTVYMEVDVAEEDQEKEAVWAVEMCRYTENPMVGAVISGRPASADFEQYLDRVAHEPEVAGLRQLLHVEATPPGFCLQKDFLEGVRELGSRGLSFDICIRAPEIPDAARLADACPTTQFILDHCGNPQVLEEDQSAWLRDIAEIAKRKNVVCKISGIVASAKPGTWTSATLAPFVNQCAEVFGPDRILFGGDWPVCRQAATLPEWITALKEIVSSWSHDEQMKLFYSNAMRVYRLGEA